jgi:hypothetical protein
MADYYVLDDDGNPVPVADAITWGVWYEHADRVVKQDYVEGISPPVGVSTVFLGLDHNFTGTGPPVLWETMVFGTSLDGRMRRYTSRDAAIMGHAELLADVRAAYDLEQLKKGTP